MMWRPCLEFAGSPPRAGPAGRRRIKRRKVKTPAVARVKSVQANQVNEDSVNMKWVRAGSPIVPASLSA